LNRRKQRKRRGIQNWVFGTVFGLFDKFAFARVTFDGLAFEATIQEAPRETRESTSIATHTRQRLDYNRQCLAEGIGNLVGGFFQSLPGSGSLTRSAINYQSGAITRMSGIYSSIIAG
jgi:hypothetical protein